MYMIVSIMQGFSRPGGRAPLGLGKTYLLMPVILCSCTHTYGTMKNGMYYLPSTPSRSRASLPSDPSNLIASTINTTNQGDQTHSRRGKHQEAAREGGEWPSRSRRASRGGANLLTPFERVEVEGGGEVFFIGDLSA